MKTSLSEVLRILSSWQSNSLLVKAVLLSPRLIELMAVVRGTISIEGSTISISDSETETELVIPLADAKLLDLNPSTGLPDFVFGEAMPRPVCGLHCRLPHGIWVFLYKLRSDDAQDVDGIP